MFEIFCALYSPPEDDLMLLVFLAYGVYVEVARDSVIVVLVRHLVCWFYPEQRESTLLLTAAASSPQIVITASKRRNLPRHYGKQLYRSDCGEEDDLSFRGEGKLSHGGKH